MATMAQEQLRPAHHREHATGLISENTTRNTGAIKVTIQRNTVEVQENPNTNRAAKATIKKDWKASELAVTVAEDVKPCRDSGPLATRCSAAQGYGRRTR
ncbi:hypothetical protein CSAL01_13332 [Colletotrichum salicis]|uniref:Uncharacterized protein n=1 Tax=Colletotrichum salicis TaxID=1209931 RepID=A0A135RPY2_9PEZI|nr:hypothetical protein CSAL01_13332 [Colletotrichum salicis]